MVFLGTVTEALKIQEGRLVRARMRIDHAYKGVTEDSLTLFDDGMCDGPDLQVGEQYLMYTRRWDSAHIPSRGCTRSRPVKYADEDLAFLNGLPDAAPKSRISGRVMARDETDRPLPGVRVEINGAGGTQTTMTDCKGEYWFENLHPETYTIAATSNGYRMLSFSDSNSRKVEPGGCAVINMVLQRTWQGRIAGRIVRASGEPAPPGIDLNLMRLPNGDDKPAWALFAGSTHTNEGGEYSFDEVAPGRYKIVMNLYRFPTADLPYPTIYWPATRDETSAIAIGVTDTVAAQRYDFRLPPEPMNVRVDGLSIGPGGKPAEDVQVYIEALPNNSIALHDENRPKTDAAGRFGFTALEGYDYRLHAIMQSGNRYFHSAYLNFNLKDGLSQLTLVCDRPGQFDDDPSELRRQRE